MPKNVLNQLDQLKLFTKVVADTGDIQAIEKFQPEDATTNPSLILKAAHQKHYQHLLMESIGVAKKSKSKAIEKAVVEIFSVKLGVEISKIVPGRISTEVDARLSFNTETMIQSAKRIIELYKEHGIDKSKVLIKLAATWEGIEAARQLECEGINCNITLIFNFYQALAAAQANAFLISPFVGRILDWYKKNHPEELYFGKTDPGVISVTQIYNHFKEYNYPTVVMGASFRNLEQIRELAGCDRLTVSPQLMQELKDSTNQLKQVLMISKAKSLVEDYKIDEENFRWMLNEDPMATEKLAEGIRSFTIDQIKLENMITVLI